MTTDRRCETRRLYPPCDRCGGTDGAWYVLYLRLNLCRSCVATAYRYDGYPEIPPDKPVNPS